MLYLSLFLAIDLYDVFPAISPCLQLPSLMRSALGRLNLLQGNHEALHVSGHGGG